MKIDIKKYYRTRDGRKAFIDEERETIFAGTIFNFWNGDIYNTSWDKNGLYNGNQEHPWDLLSEWK